MALVPACLVHELEEGINAVLHDAFEFNRLLGCFVDEVEALISLISRKVNQLREVLVEELEESKHSIGIYD